MMMTPEKVKYEFRKVYDQGDNLTCSAYAFFSVLQYLFEKENSIFVEFPIEQHYDKVVKFRKTQTHKGQLVNNVIYPIMRSYFDIAREDGFNSLNGKPVRISAVTTIREHTSPQTLKEWIHTRCPMIVELQLFRSHSLKPKTDTIARIPKNPKPYNTHYAVLSGYEGEYFWLHNSYGVPDKKLHQDDLKKMFKEGYMIYV